VTPNTQPPSPVGSLFRFHAAGGARVASRNGIVGLCAVLIVLGSAPDPLVLLRFLARGLAAEAAEGWPLVALTALGFVLARDAVPRLTLGLGGWTRSLPVDGVQHRRGVVAGLAIVQIPLAAAVVLAALLLVFVYREPLSAPKLLGAPLALIAAGAAAVPARRWLVATPFAGAAAVLAALGRWPFLAAAIATLIAADRLAGTLRFPARRATVPAPATPGTLRMFRFTWRAMGWRLVAPLPLSLLALAAAWFYTRNNELAPPDLGFVARLWSVIAVALYVGALGDIVAARRPAWPWSRSLPWSSAARAVDDAIALGIPVLGVILAAIIVDARSAVVALATLPPLAALGSAALPGARRRLTRVSGRLLLAGALLGVACAYYPWIGALALLGTPLLVRVAAGRTRREVVTGWRELYHDPAGDSLAWSAR
jgi:hypothetical protein